MGRFPHAIKVCPDCRRTIERPRPTLARPRGTVYPVVEVLCNSCRPARRWNAALAPKASPTPDDPPEVIGPDDPIRRFR